MCMHTHTEREYMLPPVRATAITKRRSEGDSILGTIFAMMVKINLNLHFLFDWLNMAVMSSVLFV